jgi:hypothetical protein
MKIYRVSFVDPIEGHAGYQFFANMRAAKKACHEHIHECREETKEREADVCRRTGNDAEGEAEISIINVKPTKKNLLHLLNQFASHPNNG